MKLTSFFPNLTLKKHAKVKTIKNVNKNKNKKHQEKP